MPKGHLLKAGVSPGPLYQTLGYGMAGHAPYKSKLGYVDPLWNSRYTQWLGSQALYGNYLGNTAPAVGYHDKDKDFMQDLLKKGQYHAYAALRTPGNNFWKQLGYGLYGNAGRGKYTTKEHGKGHGAGRYKRSAPYSNSHNNYGNFAYGISPMTLLNNYAKKGPYYGGLNGFPGFGYNYFPYGSYGGYGPYGGFGHFGGHGHFGGSHTGGHGKGGYRKKRSAYSDLYNSGFRPKGHNGYSSHGGNSGHRKCPYSGYPTSGRKCPYSGYPYYNFPFTGKMFYSPALNYNANNMANLLGKYSKPAKYY